MASGVPLLPGDSEIDQCFRIFRSVLSPPPTSRARAHLSFCRLLGTPTPEVWPALPSMPDFKLTFPKWRAQSLAEILPEMDERGLHLLSGMLVYDPIRRISGQSSFPPSIKLFRVLTKCYDSESVVASFLLFRLPRQTRERSHARFVQPLFPRLSDFDEDGRRQSRRGIDGESDDLSFVLLGLVRFWVRCMLSFHHLRVIYLLLIHSLFGSFGRVARRTKERFWLRNPSTSSDAHGYVLNNGEKSSRVDREVSDARQKTQNRVRSLFSANSHFFRFNLSYKAL